MNAVSSFRVDIRRGAVSQPKRLLSLPPGGTKRRESALRVYGMCAALLAVTHTTTLRELKMHTIDSNLLATVTGGLQVLTAQELQTAQVNGCIAGSQAFQGSLESAVPGKSFKQAGGHWMKRCLQRIPNIQADR
jgi:hypothetical protein